MYQNRSLVSHSIKYVTVTVRVEVTMLTCAFFRPYLDAQGNGAAHEVGAGCLSRQSCVGSLRRRGFLRRLKSLSGRPRAKLSHYAARPSDRGSRTHTALRSHLPVPEGAFGSTLPSGLPPLRRCLAISMFCDVGLV